MGVATSAAPSTHGSHRPHSRWAPVGAPSPPAAPTGHPRSSQMLTPEGHPTPTQGPWMRGGGPSSKRALGTGSGRWAAPGTWHRAQARAARSPRTAPHSPGCRLLSPKTPKGITSTLRFLAAQGHL